MISYTSPTKHHQQNEFSKRKTCRERGTRKARLARALLATWVSSHKLKPSKSHDLCLFIKIAILESPKFGSEKNNF
jgi:hypothetical protein